ncbi:Chitooligosaccharide deacetylase [Dissostichus eleginoides]|uniref:Chitooligosaccharide deacetylase n=1 Tax=Dissostichus eleginoides TaxID=100907 RepID=A0AAD9B385_DISEL|nr:Chitooligosaccharide deacetylase [Dissostichus eleginoides]
MNCSLSTVRSGTVVGLRERSPDELQFIDGAFRDCSRFERGAQMNCSLSTVRSGTVVGLRERSPDELQFIDGAFRDCSRFEREEPR